MHHDLIALGLTEDAKLPPFLNMGTSFYYLWWSFPALFHRLEAPVTRAILFGEATEIDYLNLALEQMLDAYYPMRADDWSIGLWENELDVTPTTSQTLDQRIATVMAKIVGIGTPTNKALKNLAMQFDNGDINIIEDPANYTVYVQFVGALGVPSNINDMQVAMRDAVPAHLNLQFMYKYFTFIELDAHNWTWSALDALALTWDALEVYS